MSAKVYLIGAGPGDPGLFTLKGMKCIQEADVVVYDYLANSTLLAYARPDAKLIFVGKKGFSQHVTQDQINECLIKEALTPNFNGSPRVIARLKGGDPFVFGRGGEEALALRAKGIDFEIIPGVTSGIAAPAYAGIPVTHRGVSSSVAFITGNEDPTKEETSIDWNGLAHGAQTLCFYMGIRNLPSITAKLMEAGRPAEEPVALVRWGTTSKQETLTGTLANIAEKAVAANFQAPAIIVVGNVAALRDQLAWRENQPLLGKTIAVTRARTQASALVNRLRELGADVLECPTIQIAQAQDSKPIHAAIDKLAAGGYQWVTFTSVNGVEHFFAYLTAHGKDARAFANTKVAAIGSATAEELSRRGIIVDVMPREYRAEAVVDALLSEGVSEGVSVLIARAAQARDVLPQSLMDAGASVDVVAVYETVRSTSIPTQQAMEAIAAGQVDGVTFTATSTVTGFAGLVDDYLAAHPQDTRTREQILAAQQCFSIGPITSAAIEKLGGTVAAHAEVYTIPGLVDAIRANFA